jgi:hypothetical protein
MIWVAVGFAIPFAAWGLFWGVCLVIGAVIHIASRQPV